MAENETNTSYRDSLKSMDTEEHIDLAFYRPIGYAWARLAAKLGITPNVITIASIFLGIGAGVAFGFKNSTESGVLFGHTGKLTVCAVEGISPYEKDNTDNINV